MHNPSLHLNQSLIRYSSLEWFDSNLKMYSLDGGITSLLGEGYLIRALANGFERLVKSFQAIVDKLEKSNISDNLY